MKTQLAVRKDPGIVPGGGFHYLLHPFRLGPDPDAAVFELLGYEIIEVEPDVADRLIKSAIAALNHQVEVAYLVENKKAENHGNQNK